MHVAAYAISDLTSAVAVARALGKKVLVIPREAFSYIWPTYRPHRFARSHPNEGFIDSGITFYCGCEICDDARTLLAVKQMHLSLGHKLKRKTLTCT